MAGISKTERIVLCLTALFCAAALMDLRRTADEAPKVQITVSRAAPPAVPKENHALLEGEHININEADTLDLQRLPGVGEKRAGEILAYREEHGGFVCLEELLLIPGIGEKTLEEIRLYADIG